MRNLTRFIASGVFALLLIAGCTKDFEGFEQSVPQEPPQATRSAVSGEETAIYDPQSERWLVPKADPYRLENMQEAYTNLGAPQLSTFSVTVESTVRQEFLSAVKVRPTLAPTHRIMKVWPKTIEEVDALEFDEELNVSEIPFDYIESPEQQDGGTLIDERRYTVTVEGGVSELGSMPAETYVMPVLYVVWPVARSLPAEMEYELLYSAYRPGEAPTRGGGDLSAEALEVLESEAINRALGVPVTALGGLIPGFGTNPGGGGLNPPGGGGTGGGDTGGGTITWPGDGGGWKDNEDWDDRIPIPVTPTPPEQPGDNWGGRKMAPSGRVVQKDNFLGVNVPVANLRIEFVLGSGEKPHCYTDQNGYFSLDERVDAQATLQFAFRKSKCWRIQKEEGSATLVERKGNYYFLWKENNDLLFVVPAQDAPDARYETLRALNFYYFGSHSIPRYSYDREKGLSVKVLTRKSEDYDGLFTCYPNIVFWKEEYIKINNNPDVRKNHANQLGVVFHELGHFTQFGMRGSFNAFDGVHDMLAESFASFVGWYLCERYYTSLEWDKSKEVPGYDLTTRQARQGWTYSGDAYSPLFVDLVDDYNQWSKYNSSLYPNDNVKGVPISVILEIADQHANWRGTRDVLREYTRSTSNSKSIDDMEALLVTYDNYFKNN